MGQFSARAVLFRNFSTRIPIGTAHPSREDIQSLAKSNLRQGEYCIGAMENGKPKVKCYNITKLLKQPI